MKNKYPYRFKTEEEMIKSFGNNWSSSAFLGVGWNSLMNGLLGKDYPYFKDQLNFKTLNNNICYDRLPRPDYLQDGHCEWMICWDMLIENIIIPNYNSKTKTKRTL